MVAGDHHRHDARRAAFGHGLARLGSRWVDEAHQAEQDHAGFDLSGVGLHRRAGPVAPGHRQYPHALGCELHRHLLRRPPKGFVGFDAQRQHGLGCALGEREPSARVGVQRAHALARRIEGPLVQPRMRPGHGNRIDARLLCTLRQGRFGGVASPLAARVERRVVAQQAGAPELAIRLPAPCLVRPRLHRVGRQRAGLVRADVGDRAQRLDRRQPPHQRVDLHHPACAERQQDGHDGRQRFGNGRDREADRRHGHQEDRFAAQQAQAEHHRADRQRHERKTLAEHRKPLLQRGAALLRLAQQRRDLAQLRGRAGGDHQPARASLRHQGALERHVVPVAQRMVAGRQARRGACRP